VVTTGEVALLTAMPRNPAAACGKTTKARTPPPLTPDGRYIVVRGRLWRASNPGLTPEAGQGYVNDLQVWQHGVVPLFSISAPMAAPAPAHVT
jgi:hypothetical protein